MTQEVHYIYQGGCAYGRSNYIYRICDMFVHSTQCALLFFIGKFVIYISCSGVILTLHLNYIYFLVDIFVYHTTMSALIYLCMLYNLIVGCTSSWVFFPISLLYMGYSSTVSTLPSQLY